MKKTIESQRGSTLVIVAGMLVMILGIAALVTDVGLSFLQKQKLSNAVDACALAAVSDLSISQEAATQTAKAYATLNGFDENSFTISFPEDGKSIEILGNSTVTFFFARVLGFDHTSLQSKAKARIAPVSAMRGTEPLAIEQFDYEFGVQYTLKEGTDDSYDGNFGGVALDGNGANTYRDYLMYSYQGTLRIGDYIDTEPGNMVGPTYDGITYRMNQCTHVPACSISCFDFSCPRIISIPIVNSMEVDGRASIQIVGFGQFLLSGVSDSGGDSEVTGWFIKRTVPGEFSLDAIDFGTRAIKLVQ